MKIAVTGLGVVSCLGNSVDELWDNICQGNTGILPFEFESDVIKTKKVGKVKNFILNPEFDARWKSKTDKHIQFALNATKQAIDQSGLNFESVDPGRVHTVIGTTAGGYDFIINNQKRIDAGKPCLPNFIPGHINNMMSSYINMHWGIEGSGLGISGACAAGSQAISVAAMLIETGQADVVVCGASDSWLSELTISGFESLGALSFNEVMPKPFDQFRDGFAISEGSAIIILESMEYAQSRNANVLAVLSGYGISNDAYHPTSPNPEGRAFLRMTDQAMNRAGISHNQVDYINAHATATKVGDAVECQNLFKIFKDNPFISSTKSMTGHSIGSTSAIEAVISILSVKNNIIPGTINLTNIDPLCPGKHVKETISHSINHAASTSFGFGGTNGILLFSKN